MIVPGRIPLTDAEHKTVERLLEHAAAPASLTRRDPGETGPLIVTVDGRTFEVAGRKAKELD